MSSEDEFDAIPDEFDGLDFDAIPDLAIVVPTSYSSYGARPASANSSSHYSDSFDHIDESFLVELDIIEARLTQGIRESMSGLSHPLIQNDTSGATPCPPRLIAVPQESPASNQPSIRGHSEIYSPKTPLVEKTVHTDFLPRTVRKSGRVLSPPVQAPPSAEKGKGKYEPNDGVRRILEGFEDEMTCPICCDIFVAAHLGNPCGHSFCGECGWGWISQNKRSPTCAVCRAKLSTAAPMIPNFALDNTVRRHLQALANNGHEEWQPGGIKINEWNIKKEKWKNDSAHKAAETTEKSGRFHQRHRRHLHVNENVVDIDDADDLAAWLVPDHDVDESYDEAAELLIPSFRYGPRRHRSGGTR